MATNTAQQLNMNVLDLYDSQKSNCAGPIIDVRSPIEFTSEHIEGSKNIPLEELVERSRELPLDTEIVFVCRTGVRAARAAQIAKDAGLKALVLDGGFLNWKSKKLPFLEGKKRLAVDRQVQLTVGVGLLTGLGLGLTVDKRFLSLVALFGAGLTFAGLTGTCGLANVLAKAPWNKIEDDSSSSCQSKK